MTLTLDDVAEIIIDASRTPITADKEDPRGIATKSRNLVHALTYHQTIFDPQKISLSLVADMLAFEYYQEDTAQKLIQILKIKILHRRLQPG